jgi:nicotinate-nucleotide adenylyltransferase
MDRLGIFGGTFDPPHCGHLKLAEEAVLQLNLDLVLWVLTPDPPHKRGRRITPWQYRLEMVTAAIINHQKFAISRVDIDRPPPHFAVDTIHLLRNSYPAYEFVYLIGGDSLRDLPDWHTPDLFLESIDWLGVLRRPHIRYNLARLEQEIDGISKKILWIDAPPIDVSSTGLRKLMSSHPGCPEQLPDAVCRIIKKHGLYQKHQV